MSTMLSKRCLVLNKTWTPVGTVNLQRAVIMLFSEYGTTGEPKARIIEPESYATYTWEDWSKLKPLATDEVIKTANMVFKVPEIILLSNYDKIPQPKIHFSRRTLYKRDEMKCQYCLKRLDSESVTIDHVVPRSKGGLTTWENCVACCLECNTRKANRTPSEAHMKLNCVPKKPQLNLFKFDTTKPIKSWSSFISSAYWSVELENDNPN